MFRLLNSENRSKQVRVPPAPSEPIRVDVNGEDFIEVLCALDISEGGISFNVGHKFENCKINGLVTFIISLPGKPRKELIKAEGIIRHVSGKRFGVQFSKLSELARGKIKHYVEKRKHEEKTVGQKMARA